MASSMSDSHSWCSPTDVQFWANSTILPQSIAPKPNLGLTWNPAPFSVQSLSLSAAFGILAVCTIMCCTSLHVSLGLESDETCVWHCFFINYILISDTLLLELTLPPKREQRIPRRVVKRSTVPWNPNVQPPWISVVVWNKTSTWRK